VPLNDGVLAGAEEEVEKDGGCAARPEQLGGHVGEGGQGAGPAVLAPALPHHSAHHPPGARQEQLQQALVVRILPQVRKLNL